MEVKIELDILADDAADHLAHAFDQFVEDNDFFLQHLPSAERQQLAGEGCGRFPGAPDFGQEVAPQGREVVFHHGQFGEPQHRLQDVVEVVGDPAGQLSDEFHFLRLRQLLFNLNLAADVAFDRDEIDQLADVIVDGGNRGVLGVQLSVFLAIDQSTCPDLPVGDGCP